MNRRMGVQTREISMDDKYQSLNEMQKRAVFQTEGPVLILAVQAAEKPGVDTPNRVPHRRDAGTFLLYISDYFYE